jgi:hypothetical protein
LLSINKTFWFTKWENLPTCRTVCFSLSCFILSWNWMLSLRMAWSRVPILYYVKYHNTLLLWNTTKSYLTWGINELQTLNELLLFHKVKC